MGNCDSARRRTTVDGMGQQVDCPVNDKNSDDFCRSELDRLGVCWNRMERNTSATMSCSAVETLHAAGIYFRPDQNVTRFCPNNGSTLTDYRKCIYAGEAFDKITWEHQLNSYLDMAGYATSLAALTVALLLFIWLRSIACPRIRLHQNLIVSFMYNSALQIVWGRVASDPYLLDINPLWCQLVNVVMLHALMSTYAWMFCEGCYLQILLIWSMVTERKVYYAMCVFGWGAPLLLVIIYVILRTSLLCTPQQLEACWSHEVPQFYSYLFGPFIVGTLVLNLLFLLNIIRIVYRKTDHPIVPSSNRRTQMRTMLKALLILLPMLGAQYLLTSFWDDIAKEGATPLKLTQVAVTSLQGLAVAIVVCFVNCEVRMTLKRKWYQWKTGLQRDSRMSRSGRNRSRLTMIVSVADQPNTICDQQHVSVEEFDHFLKHTNGTVV
uniref:Uncharacterized protein n=1 Tax=Plectus sambesii TaxID=2011161 RepID=A0A914WIT4_9BILA